MPDRVGIIGVGHLASYMVEGLRRAAPEMDIVLSRHLGTHTDQLVGDFDASPAETNQAVADSSALVVVSTRPADVVDACRSVAFQPHHLVIYTAVGVSLADVQEAVHPATAVRAMPITCSAINASPTLLFPDEPRARALLQRLGTVQVVETEDQFTPGSAIAAYYGWVYAVMEEVVGWTVSSGVEPETARELVLETTRGAAAMALANPQRELTDLLDSLATPGGITREGLEILGDRGSLEAWREALDVVLRRLKPTTPDP